MGVKKTVADFVYCGHAAEKQIGWSMYWPHQRIIVHSHPYMSARLLGLKYAAEAGKCIRMEQTQPGRSVWLNLIVSHYVKIQFKIKEFRPNQYRNDELMNISIRNGIMYESCVH